MISTEVKAIQEIAELLETDQKLLSGLLAKLEALSGQKQLPLKISNLIEAGVRRITRECEMRSKTLLEAHSELEKCVEQRVSEFHKKIAFSGDADWQRIAGIVLKERERPRGFFLKLEKAENLIFKHPPKKVIDFLGYSSVRELLGREDILEVLAALRFIEGGSWINRNFLPEYRNLRPEDFEEREIIIRPISKKWQVVDGEFIKKKFHNVTHLKEIGVVYILPREKYDAPIFFADFALLFHYLREVKFFNQLLERFLKDNPRDWQGDFIRSISGLIPEDKPKSFDRPFFFILSRYVEKFDDGAWQTYYPHLNSESLHWIEALSDLVKFGKRIGIGNLEVWRNSNWLGKLFPNKDGKKEVLSFNFVDNIFSLAHRKDNKIYNYHFKESLWNYFFIAALGKSYLAESLQKGWLKEKVEI